MTDFVYREPIKVVRDILVAQLGIKDSQAIFSNEKWNIPTTGPLIVLSYVGPGKVIGNTDQLVDAGPEGIIEIQTVTSLDMIEISAMGYDPIAMRAVRNKIQVAFNSINAEALSEQWSMQISKMPGAMMDTSFPEETGMVSRYTTSILVTSINQFQPESPDYYTDFSKAIPPQVAVNA